MNEELERKDLEPEAVPVPEGASVIFWRSSTVLIFSVSHGFML